VLAMPGWCPQIEIRQPIRASGPPWSWRASAGTEGGETGVVVNLAAHARADTPSLARATV
jgi:hypothetical protein